MKTDYKNPFIRLQEYYLLFDCIYDDNEIPETIGISIKDIHEQTNIPLELIRKDIFTIFAWQQSLIQSNPNYDYYNFININDECDTFKQSDINLINIIDNLSNKIFLTKFELLIIDGIFDDILIYRDKEYIDKMILPLTTAEAVALSSFNNNESLLNDSFKKINNSFLHTFFIKDSYLYNHHYNSDNTLNSLLETIDTAINNNQCLTIQYKPKENTSSYVFKPLKITYDSTENIYYVLSIYDNKVISHRLDRIISLKTSKEVINNQDSSLLDIAPCVWGNCFSDKPEKVKIKFYNEANVWNKVKKDLAYRTNKKLYEQDGYLYYEDTVYGINKFKSWIFSYGSSAIVIEPTSLRTDIINSLKSRIKAGA